MKTEIKIIKILIENKELTIREISKKISSDYKITYTAVQNLIKKDIISIKTIGKSSLCSLNKVFSYEIYKAEDERKQELLKNKNLNQLYKEILKIKTSFFIFLIFGSYAKNRQSKTSDIDLMFISNEKDFEKTINNVLSLLPLKTHLLVFTEEEFIRMKDSKENSVVREIIEKNIILYGIENYYKLKNA